MHPRLFTTPFFTLHTFGLLLALAYMAAYWWLLRSAEREKLDADAIGSLGLWAIVGVNADQRGRFLRRIPRRARVVGALLPPTSAAAVLAGGGSVRPLDCAWPGDRPGGLLDGRRRLRTAHDAAVGRHVHRSRSGPARRRAARRAAPSGAAVRVGCLPCALRRPRPPQPPQAVRRR